MLMKYLLSKFIKSEQLAVELCTRTLENAEVFMLLLKHSGNVGSAIGSLGFRILLNGMVDLIARQMWNEKQWGLIDAGSC